MLAKETVGPYTLIGWHPEEQMFFQQGNPEVWRDDGRWREDGKDCPWDIVQNLGVEQPLQLQ